MSKPKKPTGDIVRSSAAEYLTFVAATGDQAEAIEVRYQDVNVWLTQKMMATLYEVTVSAINQQLKRLTEDGEIDEVSVIKNYLITAADGKSYNTKHYNLQATVAVGFKIENDRAVQYRKWAGQIVKDYTIQEEMDHLERIVSMYLDFAGLQVTRKIQMSMEDWATRLDGFLQFNEHEILVGPGRISHEKAKLHAETEFEKYRIVQDRMFRSDFDRFVTLDREAVTKEEEI